jgi:hypothetical protein
LPEAHAASDPVQQAPIGLAVIGCGIE